MEAGGQGRFLGSTLQVSFSDLTKNWKAGLPDGSVFAPFSQQSWVQADTVIKRKSSPHRFVLSLSTGLSWDPSCPGLRTPYRSFWCHSIFGQQLFAIWCFVTFLSPGFIENKVYAFIFHFSCSSLWWKDSEQCSCCVAARIRITIM